MKDCICDNCVYTRRNGGYMVCLTQNIRSDINDLLDEYDMLNVSDDRLISMTERYLSTMEDSQVKCILYILKEKLKENYENSL